MKTYADTKINTGLLPATQSSFSDLISYLAHAFILNTAAHSSHNSTSPSHCLASQYFRYNA